jgi:triacylglycerol lipase
MHPFTIFMLVCLIIISMTLGVLVIYGSEIIRKVRNMELRVRSAWFDGDDCTVHDCMPTTRDVDVPPVDKWYTRHVHTATFLGDIVSRLDVAATQGLNGSYRPAWPPRDCVELLQLEAFESDGPLFGVMYSAEGMLILACRGTTTAREVALDLDAHQVAWAEDVTKELKVHEGFSQLAMYYWDRVEQMVRDHPTKTVFVSGHSLGAAVPTLLVHLLALQFPDRKFVGYVFGCPRVGNPAFHDHFQSLSNVYFWRVKNDADLIQDMPMMVTPSFGDDPHGPNLYYQHAGEEWSFHRNLGSWQKNHAMPCYMAQLDDWWSS